MPQNDIWYLNVCYTNVVTFTHPSQCLLQARTSEHVPIWARDIYIIVRLSSKHLWQVMDWVPRISRKMSFWNTLKPRYSEWVHHILFVHYIEWFTKSNIICLINPKNGSWVLFTISKFIISRFEFSTLTKCQILCTKSFVQFAF